MKRNYIVFIFFSIILFISNPLYAEGLDQNQLSIDTGEIDDFVREIFKENHMDLGGDLKELATKIVKGEKILPRENIMKSISSVFFSELKLSLSLLSKILVVTIASTILTNLQTSFERSSIAQLANYITYILIAIMVITSFTQIMEMARTSIGKMTSLMQVLLPVLLTLLVIAGGPNTKIVFHPMILAAVNVLGIMIKNIIFPLIYFSFIISILSNLSEKTELGKLSEIGRQIATFIISAAFTIFIGILTIYGLSTKIDGISIRTAKFAVDTFVPIVGGFLSDAVDAVIGSTTILKNGIGIVGLLVLILIILTPIIKLTVLLLVFLVTGAVIEPIASKNITDFFGDISKTVLLILVSLLSIGIMFFITITMIVDAGNSLLMLR
ncbi:MAG TPA: stage III sporulation protein AE [Tissierellaceae bacterium]|nr:stage III sporulation protein AE [Tissierellaceae bacterium]